MSATLDRPASPHVTLTLRDSVNLRALEEGLRNVSEARTPVLVDLREASFIEPASLVVLVSTFLRWRQQERSFEIALPSNKNVRDFLRIWQFPEALHDAGFSFWRIVRKADRAYFGENETVRHNVYAGDTHVREDAVERLVSQHFFSLLAFHPREIERKADLLIQETSRWRQELVRTVLETHLNGPSEYVPSRLIYEAITNALRHPNAGLIIITSAFDHAGKLLTITVWDDGESIVDTLRRPLIEGRGIRADGSLAARYDVIVKLQQGGEVIARETVDTTFTPEHDTDDQRLLLASVFPGITSDPERVGAIPDDNASSNGPGMGLFVLLNAAVDIFGGSMAIRTKDLFLNLKAASRNDGAHYRAKIATTTNFLGNMLTIRLPVSPKETASITKGRRA